MDLNTVEKKLKSGAYPSSYHFALDIRKIWNNSWTFNDPTTPIHMQTTEISNEFEKLMKEVGDLQFVPEENPEIQSLKKQLSKVEGAVKRIAATGASGGPVSAPIKTSGTPKTSLDRPMTSAEKAQLRQKIMQLSQDKLPGVVNIIRDSIDMPKNQEILEFDIDSLPTRTCRELEKYVNSMVGGAVSKQTKKKPETKAKPTKAKPSQQVAPQPAPISAPKSEVTFA